jgi:hypothetical protein
MAYIHSVPGRLRVKCASLKGNDRLARAVEGELATVQGVRAVRYNAHAHSLTITHDPARVTGAALLAHLKARGIGCDVVGAPKTRPVAAPVAGAVLTTAASAVGGAFGRAIFGAVLKTSLERGVATLVTSAIR